MKKTASKKILWLLLMLFMITSLSFVIIHLAPGSAVDSMTSFNPKVSAQAKARLEHLYGLDKPLWQQYVLWVKRVVCFDFGVSLKDGRSVAEKIGEALPVTLWINFIALFIVYTAGIFLGLILALKKGTALQKGMYFICLAALCMPTFWLSLVLASWFGVNLHWFAVTGLTSVDFNEMTSFEKMIDLGTHLALPVLVLVITGLGALVLYAEKIFTDILLSPYILAAKAAGLNSRVIYFKYALKNGLLSFITLLGLSIPGLVGGSVILETIFSLPGMGRLFYESVFIRDYPVIMGILVLTSFLTLFGNLAADLCYRWADPRMEK